MPPLSRCATTRLPIHPPPTLKRPKRDTIHSRDLSLRAFLGFIRRDRPLPNTFRGNCHIAFIGNTTLQTLIALVALLFGGVGLAKDKG